MMTQDTWLAVTPSCWLFGFRPAPGGAGSHEGWEHTIRKELHGTLIFASDSWLLEQHDRVGRYQLKGLEDVAAIRTDLAEWSAPHPYPGVGRTVGFLAVNWRQTLALDDRVRLSRLICFSLQGFVLRDGMQKSLDPLVSGDLDFEMFTTKYATSGFLLHNTNQAYSRYVEEQVARAARRAGLDAYPDASGRFHVSGGKRKRVNPRVKIWYFSFQETDARAFLRD